MTLHVYLSDYKYPIDITVGLGSDGPIEVMELVLTTDLMYPNAGTVTGSTFPAALRVLVDERGMSQAELARRLGVSAQSVSSWIVGNSTPTMANVIRLEDELAAERGSLLAPAGYAINNTDQPSVESLIRADPNLDPEDKRVLLRILQLARDRHA